VKLLEKTVALKASSVVVSTICSGFMARAFGFLADLIEHQLHALDRGATSSG